MMRFRKANSDDIAAMSQIRLSVSENVLSDPSLVTLQMYEDYLEKFGSGWVCEKSNQIIGFSYADRENSSIWALFVKPEFEGIGAGKELIKLASQWLFEQGAEKITLSTDANTRGDKFYKLQGWTREGLKDECEVFYSLRRNSIR
ncbi:N-acetyltransferase family protein [Thalassotalea ganghwensis]